MYLLKLLFINNRLTLLRLPIINIFEPFAPCGHLEFMGHFEKL